jgi:hypothetical protein
VRRAGDVFDGAWTHVDAALSTAPSTPGRSPPGQRLRAEDDAVMVGGRTEVRLSQIVRERNDRISFPADVLDVVSVER